MENRDWDGVGHLSSIPLGIPFFPYFLVLYKRLFQGGRRHWEGEGKTKGVCKYSYPDNGVWPVEIERLLQEEK